MSRKETGPRATDRHPDTTRQVDSPDYSGSPDNADLITAANAIVACHTGGLLTITEASRPAIMLAYAIVYAVNGWEVFPLGARKAPRIKSPHPKGSRCKGECGRDGHGVHDATTDITTICRWWGVAYRGANIGGRVPTGLFVIDLDPRKPGHAAAMAKLTNDHGPLRQTLTTISGRGDGGRHLFYRRPPGRLSISRLGPEFVAAADPGIDIKDRGGLIVLPPSIHHVTGKSYTSVDAAIAVLPPSLIEKITVPPAPPRPAPPSTGTRFISGQSPTRFNDTTSWADVLEPADWTCKSADPDADGAVWLHPTHTSDCSATISGGRLYVYSPNTPFEATGGGFRHGYSKFDAHQLLNRGIT
jgi:Bifunctional DNA primase/polymerase, N-terminal